MKIGFLIVATNKYIRFVHPLVESVKKHLKIRCDYTFFIFTDQPNVPSNCIKIYQEHKPFPYPTLMRYHMFYNNKSIYENCDYLYYLDADMLMVGDVGDEIITDRLAVQHPGFFHKQRCEYTYEHRKESTAYIDSSEGSHYFCGGFNGGKTSLFLQMSETIKSNVDKDTHNGIVALWHDESHFNRYMVNNPPTKILNPSYCYPGQGLAHVLGISNLPRKIHALDKNHEELRS